MPSKSKVFFPIFSLLLLFGCSSPKIDVNLPLRIHLEGAPATLDPAQATGHRENAVFQGIYEGLTRYHPKTLETLPGVAESWEVSPDGLTYTFHLRKEAKWSDGKPVEAEDFWRGWERVLNPKTASKYAFLLYYIKNGEQYNTGKIEDSSLLGMKVLDSQTFQVTLERNNQFFDNVVAFYSFSPYRGDRLYNGAFIVTQWDDQRILLKPNEHYWGKEDVHLNEVQFLLHPNFDVALKRYDMKNIDILADLPPERVPLLKWRNDYKTAPLLRSDFLRLNLRYAPLQNIHFRKALSLAIDREQIVNDVLKRGDIPYGALVPPNMPNYDNQDLNRYDFDPERGRELLKEAGYSYPKALPSIEIVCGDSSEKIFVAEAIAKMWKENLGILTTVRGVSWNDYLEIRTTGDYQVAWGAWYGDFLDPTSFLDLFISNQKQNYTRWANPLYDALLKKAADEKDKRSRASTLKQAEKLILEEAPVIPILVKSKNNLIRPYVKGYYNNLRDLHPLRDVYMVER